MYIHNGLFTFEYLEPEREYELSLVHINSDGKKTMTSVKKYKTLRLHPLSDIISDRNTVIHEHFILKDRFRKFELGKRLQTLGLDYLRIPIMGAIGNGKSNFICTLESILSDNFNSTKSHYAKSKMTLTTKLKELSFSLNNQIKLVDTFGIDGSNWKALLEPFLAGDLPYDVAES
jgi:hypothetical protein